MGYEYTVTNKFSRFAFLAEIVSIVAEDLIEKGFSEPDLALFEKMVHTRLTDLTVCGIPSYEEKAQVALRYGDQKSVIKDLCRLWLKVREWA